MAFARTFVIILALGFAFSIYWAGFVEKADLFQSFGEITGNPWGVVTVLDLYLGFFLFSVVILFLEDRVPIALVWIVLLFVLGNIVSAVYLAVRGLTLLRRDGP